MLNLLAAPSERHPVVDVEADPSGGSEQYRAAPV
jgi:hypothetical protein